MEVKHMISMNGTTTTDSTYQSYNIQSTNNSTTTDTTETESTRKSGNYGKTIGDAKLSEEGAKYYDELKKK
jgi:hypothetical protein